MYNHKVKEVKFTFFKSNFLKKKNVNSNKALVFYLENIKDAENTVLPNKVQLKKSFFFKNLSKVFLKKNSIAGGGSMFKTRFDIENNPDKFIQFIKENSCIVAYNSIYWTLNKILSLSLEKNTKEALVSFLIQNLKKTLSCFLPFKSLLSNLKLKASE